MFKPTKISEIKTVRDKKIGHIMLQYHKNTMMVLWFCRQKNMTWYENDLNGLTFDTIKAAKNYCVENFDRL